MSESILVICPHRPARLVQALGALAGLRTHHKEARIVGLCHADVMFIARELPYFDDIRSDVRSVLNLRGLWRLRSELRDQTFARVYDFEQSRLSGLTFRLMYGSPDAARLSAIPWSGAIAGTALFQASQPGKHYMDRLQDQLRAAGVYEALRPDVSWAARQVRTFSAPFRMDQPFAMLSLDTDTRDAWPAARFAQLAEWLTSRGLTPLLVGFSPRSDVAAEIRSRCPEAIDLTGRAPLIDTVFLAWAAVVAIGADSTLMNIAASANCRSIVLCGAGSDAATGGPRGQRVQRLDRPHLAEITVPEVLTLLGDLGTAER